VDFTQQLTIVVLFLAALGAAVWTLRRKNVLHGLWPVRRRSGRRMRSVERLALTPHHSLHLVSIDGRTVIVGVSPAGCQLIEADPKNGAGC
jgi:hypothetical protein